jgi:antitoxin (DNA-binding transcriptional repressor) of toxin-antitoxin stability system
MEISATESRKRLFELFDACDRGDDVRIVRRGTTYRLTVAGARKKPAKGSITLEWVDPAVERGQWTFEAPNKGSVAFKARK